MVQSGMKSEHRSVGVLKVRRSEEQSFSPQTAPFPREPYLAVDELRIL